MEEEALSPLPAPRPRPFPFSGEPRTPRCGHTLTALAGPDGELQGARLILFGEQTADSVACKPSAGPGPGHSLQKVPCQHPRQSVGAARAGGATALEGPQRPDGGVPASPGPSAGSTGEAALPCDPMLLCHNPSLPPNTFDGCPLHLYKHRASL